MSGMLQPDLDGFCGFVENILVDAGNARGRSQLDLIDLDTLTSRLDLCERMGIDLLTHLGAAERVVLEALLASVHVEQQLLRSQFGEAAAVDASDLVMALEYTGKRPKVVIPYDDLLMLRHERFSTREISLLYGVSHRTIKSRCQEYGITEQVAHSQCTDDELDSAISAVLRNFPAAGYRLVWGHLKSQGLLVSYERVRRSMHRIDPLGIAQRWSMFIPRRKYSVHGPNALWHIDGNHKLIRWGFVIHGGIDGFTRMVVFLKCNTNNRAATVVECFAEAIHSFGCPSRVRTDHGGENVDIGRMMLQLRGEDSRCFLTGPSTHNQRIERLWKDVNRVVSKLFRTIFIAMENDAILDTSNELHLLVLQYVFLPRIRHNLNMFVEAWNNHKLSTEGLKTPRQLWILGALERGVSGIAAEEVDELYGVDPDGQSVDIEECHSVVVEDILPRYHAETEFLEASFDPNLDDGNFGVNWFLHGKALLGLL